jgi:hypothetical protein
MSMKALILFLLLFSFPYTAMSQTKSACNVTEPNEGGFFRSVALKSEVGDGNVVFKPGGPGFVDVDGAMGIKWAWVRLERGLLYVSGKRLDREAPPARAYVSDGYGDIGFQPTYLVFPTSGCWEITGRVGESTLVFVVNVEIVGNGPSWRWTRDDVPAEGWRVTGLSNEQ